MATTGGRELQSVASQVPFSDLCSLLESISKRKGIENKKQLLRQFVQQWKNCGSRSSGSDGQAAASFYPALRLIIPQCERQRVAYGIKETTLAKLYIEILCLGKQSADALKLLNFRTPKHNSSGTGDFATVAYYILKNRCPTKGTLTVADVNESLDGVAESNAEKKKAEVKSFLLGLLRSCTALEQKWLIRMIMKDVKTGLSQASVFATYHEDAEELYNVCNDLGKVCRELRDPGKRLHEICVALFSPASPMLAERVNSLTQAERIMGGGGGAFYVETKYDGERIQLHRRGGTYKYYSRNAHEYTETFGGDGHSGTLTRHIDGQFRSDVVTACILDGEMVGYNPTLDMYGTKGENFDIKSAVTGVYQPCYFVFDILLYNDQVLTGMPLEKRLEYLTEEKLFVEIKGRIQFANRKRVGSKQELLTCLNDAIDAREEGLVVKSPASLYKPKSRKGGWLKVKPEYMDSMSDTLDLLVIGAYFGEGKRSSLLSHFLLALADDSERAVGSGEGSGSKPGVFHSFAKVGSGYSISQLEEINRKLAPHFKVCNKSSLAKMASAGVLLAKEKPEVWIEPKNSMIFEVKATEITISDKFKTGVTLRFPRVERVRDDKAWYECMRVSEVEEMQRQGGGKLVTRHVQLSQEDADGESDEDAPDKKRPRRVVSRRAVQPVMVGEQFRAADTSTVTQVSEMFRECGEMCVINGSREWSKAALEKLVVQFGGRVVQNPGGATHCVLAHDLTLRVNNLIKAGTHNIVHVRWLIECTQSGRRRPWLPTDMIHATADVSERFKRDFDEFGDSYTEPITGPEQLKDIFSRVPVERGISAGDIAEVEEEYSEYFADDAMLGLFRQCVIYVDDNRVVGDAGSHIDGDPLEVVALEARCHGATLSPDITASTTHVIVNTDHRLHDINRVNRERRRKFHVVTRQWIKACVENKTLVSERGYIPSK